MDITIAILQLLIPIALLIWQGMPSDSRLGWALKTALALGYLTAIAVAGLWMAVPWWIPYLLLAVWLLLAIAFQPDNHWAKSAIRGKVTNRICT